MRIKNVLCQPAMRGANPSLLHFLDFFFLFFWGGQAHDDCRVKSGILFFSPSNGSGLKRCDRFCFVTIMKRETLRVRHTLHLKIAKHKSQT